MQLDFQNDSLGNIISKLDLSVENEKSFDLNSSSELIDNLERIKEDKFLLESDFHNECRSILNSRQHLILISFDHRFRREMQQMLKKFMHNKKDTKENFKIQFNPNGK